MQLERTLLSAWKQFKPWQHVSSGRPGEQAQASNDGRPWMTAMMVRMPRTPLHYSVLLSRLYRHGAKALASRRHPSKLHCLDHTRVSSERRRISAEDGDHSVMSCLSPDYRIHRLTVRGPALCTAHKFGYYISKNYDSVITHHQGIFPNSLYSSHGQRSVNIPPSHFSQCDPPLAPINTMMIARQQLLLIHTQMINPITSLVPAKPIRLSLRL